MKVCSAGVAGYCKKMGLAPEAVQHLREDRYTTRHYLMNSCCSILRRLSIGLLASAIAIATFPPEAQALEEYPTGHRCINKKEIFRIVCR